MLRLTVLICMGLFFASPAFATGEPTVVITPQPLPAAQQKIDDVKIKKALSVAATLNDAEKKKLVTALRRQLPKKTAAEKAEDRKATYLRWQAETPDDKADRAKKEAAEWKALSNDERNYRHGRFIERLKALPEADRTSILAAIQPIPSGEKK